MPGPTERGEDFPKQSSDVDPNAPVRGENFKPVHPIAEAEENAESEEGE